MLKVVLKPQELGLQEGLVGVVGSQAVSTLLEPAGNRPVVPEGIIQVGSHPCFDQSVMDPLHCVVPLSPVLAQFSILLFQFLFVEGHLPQLVDVSFHSHIVKV